MENPTLDLSNFVGRTKEQDTLRNEFNQARHSNQHRFVVISGDYGTGKSTLVEKFIQEENQYLTTLMVGRGKCNSETRMSGLMPFYQALLDLTKNYTQSHSHAEVASIGGFFERVALPWLEVIAPGSEAAAKKTISETRKYFGRDIEFSVQSMMAQYMTTLLKMIGKRPAILFLDDFHLADTSSMGLLDFLGRNLKDASILFIITLRPVDMPKELKDALSELNARNLSVDIRLDHSNGIPVKEYADRRFPENQFSERSIQLVEELTEGNPLWVEQLFSFWQENNLIVKSSFPDGSSKWTIQNEDELRYQSLQMGGKKLTDSLSKIIGERIRLLDPDLQRLLNYASVIGDDFSAQTLAELSTLDAEKLFEDLALLERSYRMVAASGTRPVPSGIMDIYRFTPLFTREIIYRSLPGGLARLLHKRVGDSLEKLDGDQKQLAGQLAAHYDLASEHLKSARYALIAAVYEQENSSFTEGEKWCKFGLKQLTYLPAAAETQDLKFELLRSSAEGFGDQGMATEAEKLYEEALDLGMSAGLDPERIATVCVKLAYTCRYEGKVDQGIRYTKLGKQVLLEHHIPLCDAYIALDLNNIFLQRDENPEKAYYSLTKLIEYAETLPESDGLDSIIARAYQWLGVISGDHLNWFDVAEDAYNQSIKISRAINQKYVETMCHLNLADDYYKMRNLEAGLHHVQLGLDLAKSIHDLDDQAFAMETRGAILIAKGNYQEGIKDISEAIEISMQIESYWNMGYMYADLSLGQLGTGDYEYAKQTALLAVEKSTEGKIQKGYALSCLAKIEAACGDWDSAKQHFEESITLLTEAKTRLFLVRCRFDYARNLISHGDIPQAAAILKDVVKEMTALNLKSEAEEAQQLLDSISGER